MFRTERFAPSASDHESVKAAGREVVEKGFAVLDKALAGKNYIAGNEFSPADTALFYVEFWAANRLNMKLPANVAPVGATGHAAGGPQLKHGARLQRGRA